MLSKYIRGINGLISSVHWRGFAWNVISPLNHISFFSTKKYDIEVFTKANNKLPESQRYVMSFYSEGLTQKTATFTKGSGTVCVFVNDIVNQECLNEFKDGGVSLIALRCAGFNNIDLRPAQLSGIRIVRVPGYSPYAVAEHTMALALAVNRKIPRAYNRTRECNFALDGLMGFDFAGKTVGIIGMGKVGKVFAKICNGFGMKILYYDLAPSPEVEKLGGQLVPLDDLFANSKLITLHCPLTQDTKHIVNKRSLELMKMQPIIVNTGRGGLIESAAIIEALKNKRISGLGIDVYEQEANLFFEDHSTDIMTDDVFARLMTFSNVIVTGHQAFFTEEALINIATTTLENINQMRQTGVCANEVTVTEK